MANIRCVFFVTMVLTIFLMGTLYTSVNAGNSTGFWNQEDCPWPLHEICHDKEKTEKCQMYSFCLSNRGKR
nr:VS5842 [Ampulex compressa]